MTEAQDDLIRTVALACFSYEYEDINQEIAERYPIARSKLVRPTA